MVCSRSPPSLLRRSVEIRLRFGIRQLADQGPYRLGVRVVVGEVDAAVEAREARLVRCIAERRERDYCIDGRDPRLDASETAGEVLEVVADVTPRNEVHRRIPRPDEGVAAREQTKHSGARAREHRVAREVPREGRCQVVARVVGHPLLARDLLGRSAWSPPGQDRLGLLGVPDGSDRPHAVVLPLDVPGHDARVERRVVHGEKHLHVLINRVLVALRDILGEPPPVARRELGVRAVGPVLDDELARVVQIPAELDHLVDIILVLAGVPHEVRRGYGQATIKLIRRRERERVDPLPVGTDERLPAMGVVDQRLPAIGIHDVRPQQ